MKKSPRKLMVYDFSKRPTGKHLTEGQFADHIMGLLPPDKQHVVQVHLQSCERCRTRVVEACTTLLDPEMRERLSLVPIQSDHSPQKSAAQAKAQDDDIGTNTTSDSYDDRLERARDEKLAIALCVSTILSSPKYQAEAIGLDGGTTTEAIAHQLAAHAQNGNGRSRLLATNHCGIPRIINEKPQSRIEVEGIGGKYRADRETFVGRKAEEHIRRYLKFAACVLGINGFEPPYLLTGSGEEDGVKRAFIQSSRDIVFVFDSSKWGVRSGSKLAHVSDLFGRDLLGDFEASIASEQRTVWLVTTYAGYCIPESSGKTGEILRHRERFFAGVESLKKHVGKQFTCSLVPVLVQVSGGNAEVKKWGKDSVELNDLTADYFDTIESMLHRAKSGNRVLVTVFQLESMMSSQRDDQNICDRELLSCLIGEGGQP